MNSLKKLYARIDRINERGIGEVLGENDEVSLEVPFSLPGEVVEYINNSAGEVTQIYLKKT